MLQMARKNVTPYVKNEYLRSSSSAGGVNVKGAYLLLRSIAHKLFRFHSYFYCFNDNSNFCPRSFKALFSLQVNET